MNDKQNKAAALEYRLGIDSAPTLVAKGRGLVADKIVAIAKERGIPIHEDRNMVEILSTLSLHEEIPPELYKAVAEILVFIHKLSGKA
jgi:flagellar biosynthesis protein